eukprot:TRINITY_DN8149_c0_g1_i1.p1 TRINITY_DN8149_c0_g1~~TRINITY_DN8149_c0_g1_i1.p1  ORF type:complete len:115 (+),score=8.10 TRINITY_DN8149_c0_g1_i1:823-1167(+)
MDGNVAEGIGNAMLAIERIDDPFSRWALLRARDILSALTRLRRGARGCLLNDATRELLYHCHRTEIRRTEWKAAVGSSGKQHSTEYDDGDCVNGPRQTMLGWWQAMFDHLYEYA